MALFSIGESERDHALREIVGSVSIWIGVGREGIRRLLKAVLRNL